MFHKVILGILAGCSVALTIVTIKQHQLMKDALRAEKNRAERREQAVPS